MYIYTYWKYGLGWGDMFLRVLVPNVSKVHDIAGYIPVIFPYHIFSFKNHHYIRCVFL